MTDELLASVKNYLDITWDDEGTNTKLTGIVERGMKYINYVAGTELDYAIEDKPKELLLEYARYARSNALDEFQTNYLHELLSLQIQEEVKAYAAEQDSDV